MTMHDTNDWFNTATFWEYTSQNEIIAYLDGLHSKPGIYQERVISYEQLARIHQFLPDALQAMLVQYEKDMPGKFLPQSNVLTTLRLLNNEIVEFKDYIGDFRRVANISVLTTVPGLLERVLITGDAFSTSTLSVAGNTIEFVIAKTHRDSYVYMAELEKRYPGWHNRWQFAQTMGVDAEDMVHEIFKVPCSTAHSVFPDITFD